MQCVLNHFSRVRLSATSGPWPASPLCPWDSPGKNTGVGCHVLLQWQSRKWVKWEVAQSCPTLRDPMDCSPPGSPIRGIFQARVLEWGATAFSSVSSEFSLFQANSTSSTSASQDRFGGGVSSMNGGSRHRPWTLIAWLQDLALNVSYFYNYEVIIYETTEPSLHRGMPTPAIAITVTPIHTNLETLLSLVNTGTLRHIRQQIGRGSFISI